MTDKQIKFFGEKKAEILELAKPVAEALARNFHPHAIVIVRYGFIEFLIEECGMPVDVPD